jgi:hypothetical protein
VLYVWLKKEHWTWLEVQENSKNFIVKIKNGMSQPATLGNKRSISKIKLSFLNIFKNKDFIGKIDKIESPHYRKKRSLPSVKCIAECFLSGTRQRASLPSVVFGTRQRHLCQVPFLDTRQRVPLPSVFLEH